MLCCKIWLFPGFANGSGSTKWGYSSIAPLTSNWEKGILLEAVLARDVEILKLNLRGKLRRTLLNCNTIFVDVD